MLEGLEASIVTGKMRKSTNISGLRASRRAHQVENEKTGHECLGHRRRESDKTGGGGGAHGQTCGREKLRQAQPGAGAGRVEEREAGLPESDVGVVWRAGSGTEIGEGGRQERVQRASGGSNKRQARDAAGGRREGCGFGLDSVAGRASLRYRSSAVKRSARAQRRPLYGKRVASGMRATRVAVVNVRLGTTSLSYREEVATLETPLTSDLLGRSLGRHCIVGRRGIFEGIQKKARKKVSLGLDGLCCPEPTDSRQRSHGEDSWMRRGAGGRRDRGGQQRGGGIRDGRRGQARRELPGSIGESGGEWGKQGSAEKVGTGRAYGELIPGIRRDNQSDKWGM
ncbi:hypothetical protein B0H11DRAFT_1941096 [Mycena galericulata]|nr:hypothetical protein B0H11DRAFT_1941096 [Mycena galericulata]